MCTLSIFTRIVRWRVKDFASCFLASRFPLAAAEEEAAETNPKETIVLDRKEKDESGGKEINMPLPTTLSTNIVSVDKESDYSSRPCFSDEDYIVFCFKEDGAFILMEDGNKSEESMLQSAEDDEGRSNEAETSAAKHQGDGERSNIWWEVEDRTVSVESSGSNQSDGSTGSFAFPVYVSWIFWKIQVLEINRHFYFGQYCCCCCCILNTRKIKPHSLHFQCLRF